MLHNTALLRMRCIMSANGTKRTSPNIRLLSAPGSKADMTGAFEPPVKRRALPPSSVDARKTSPGIQVFISERQHMRRAELTPSATTLTRVNDHAIRRTALGLLATGPPKLRGTLAQPFRVSLAERCHSEFERPICRKCHCRRRHLDTALATCCDTLLLGLRRLPRDDH